MNDKLYSEDTIWELDDYPNNYRERFSSSISKAINKFLNDITPRTVSSKARLDYSDDQQKPILDAARDGQVKEAVTQLQDYVKENPNSSSAVYNLAVLTDALGQYEEALTYYNKALSLGGKDYYTDAKSSCMKRLNVKREMEGVEPEANTEPDMNTTQQNSKAEEAQSTNNTSDVRPGNGGKDIKWIQSTLNNLDYDCGTADGIMGGHTHSCIRSFQKANSLKVTGSMNEATYGVILDKQK